jgi:hypothetical protein
MKNFTLILSMIVLFTFQIKAQEQFENPGFEDWEEITDQFGEPLEWSTVKTCIPENIAGLAPVPLEKETGNVHSGTAALKLITKSTMAGPANGMITNGRVFASLIIEDGYTFIDPEHEEWHTVLTHRPDSVVGWYRSNPEEGDHGAIRIIIAEDSTAVPATDSSLWIGYGFIDFSSEAVEEWTRFSFPITYYNSKTPKYIHAILYSSRGFDATEGSEIWYDDLKLIYNPSSIDEISDGDFNIYTIGNNLFVYIKSVKHQELTMRLIDLQGRTILTDHVYTNLKKNLHINANPGIYIAVFTTGNGQKYSRKILISKD